MLSVSGRHRLRHGIFGLALGDKTHAQCCQERHAHPGRPRYANGESIAALLDADRWRKRACECASSARI